MPALPILLRPFFHPDDPESEIRCQTFFITRASVLANLVGSTEALEAEHIQAFRWESLNLATNSLGTLAQPVRLTLSILSDLALHGWGVNVSLETRQVHIVRPLTAQEAGGGTVGREIEKERVRRALRVARDEQLAQPSVRAFIQGMTQPRLGPMGWCSVLSLVRDGQELAQNLQGLGENPTAEVLNTVVSPYLQFISDGDHCEWTGLRLADVWRYFRHTWLNPARSTPGRQMMILIRDAAVTPHPVIGIAALSSAIVQQSARDQKIGWDGDSVVQRARSFPTDRRAKWLLESLAIALSGIYSSDLIEDDELNSPTLDVIVRLRGAGENARAQHQAQAKNSRMRRQQAEVRWDEIVTTPLYLSKRALALADLLSIRHTFQSVGFTEPSGEMLRHGFSTGKAFEKAVARLVRQIKAAHVGINLMDISVAGAIAPYNALLGGKLVSLLLMSPEVRYAYSQRYGNSSSVIASGMRGAPVIRTPELVLLCTTGLFGGGSSQYNRVTMPTSRVAGKRARGELRYIRLENETRFTTFHISQITMDEMRRHAEQWHEGSTVHNIFGEGVNPKMRKIREGLTRVGFPAQEILQAGGSRTVYMIPLARNFRKVLLGQTANPAYILEVQNVEAARAMTLNIARFWQERWLAGRIARPGVLDSVRLHTLTYPVRHGAIVALPQETDVDDVYEPEDVMDDCIAV